MTEILRDDKGKQFVYKHLSGWAIHRLLANYPNLPHFYMGLESKGHDMIYDVAYSVAGMLITASEVIAGMKLKSFNEIAVGGLDPSAAKGLVDMAKFYQKDKRGKIEYGRMYRVRYYPEFELNERTEDFKTWYTRIYQREPNDLKEKLQWYIEYGGKRDE